MYSVNRPTYSEDLHENSVRNYDFCSFYLGKNQLTLTSNTPFLLKNF